MRTYTPEDLLRLLARRYALAQRDQQDAGSAREREVCGAEMLLLGSLARNDLGATWEEWETAIRAAQVGVP